MGPASPLSRCRAPEKECATLEGTQNAELKQDALRLGRVNYSAGPSTKGLRRGDLLRTRRPFDSHASLIVLLRIEMALRARRHASPSYVPVVPICWGGAERDALAPSECATAPVVERKCREPPSMCVMPFGLPVASARWAAMKPRHAVAVALVVNTE